MSLETGVGLIVAVVSLGTTLLLAGRVVFRTEADVVSLQKRADAAEARASLVEQSSRNVERELDALKERVTSLRRDLDTKASLEAVVGVRESVDGLKALMATNFAHLEQLIKRERE